MLNLDDPETRALAEAVPEKVISYGLDAPGADFMGKDLQILEDGVEFTLHAEGERYHVRLAVPGAIMPPTPSRRSLPRGHWGCGSRTRSRRSRGSKASSAGSKRSGKRRA